MAIKTFTTGEVLTASDTNTYLANSGLVYVKSQTIGTAVSSVTVTGAFSSTYDNYKIVINGGTATTNDGIAIRMGASTTTYYMYLAYWTWGGTAGAVSANPGAFWQWAGVQSTQYTQMNIDLYEPYAANWTRFSGMYVDSGLMGPVAGVHKTATSYTDFTMLPATGTMTGGTITVYGYRKA